MNRRKATGVIFGGLTLFLAGGLSARKKKKKGKGKNNNNKNNNKAKKLSGKVILTEVKITRTYKLVGNGIYSFSKAVESKIKQYEGQTITVYGRVENGRIVSIEAVLES